MKLAIRAPHPYNVLLDTDLVYTKYRHLPQPYNELWLPAIIFKGLHRAFHQLPRWITQIVAIFAWVSDVLITRALAVHIGGVIVKIIHNPEVTFKMIVHTNVNWRVNLYGLAYNDFKSHLCMMIIE